ncbi:STAS domain-containing protein [Yinghuangia sp. YIM S10712]|uniref:STAS domain-containing protein n=1 Tax=Yinghuangia sp. YIM S10712 TaxID=3436930 RepID=UPI003F535473
MISETFGVVVRHARRHDGCVLAVRGDLNTASAAAFRAAVRAAVGAHDRLILDLSAMVACDGAGLSALVGCSRMARTHDCDLRLRAVPRFLARHLRLSPAGGAFSIEPAEH